MKETLGQLLHKIHIAASSGNMNTVNEALEEVKQLFEKIPLPVLNKENHKHPKRKAA